MDHITSKMLMYGDMPKDSILMELSDICTNLRDNTQSRDVLVTRIYKQIKRILVVATEYAFDKNLWHNYLTFHSVLPARRWEPAMEVSMTWLRMIFRNICICLIMIFHGLKMHWE